MNKTIELTISLLVGIMFSVGLSISQMVNPNVVIGFLDIFGKWNETLLYVMIGAILTGGTLYKVITSKRKSYLGFDFSIPTITQIDKPLVIGAVIFGIGWGISGICPGPAIANLFLLNPKILAFVIAMIVGMSLHKFLKI